MADGHHDPTWNYHWGRGLDIPAANLKLGGYANVTFEDYETRPDAITLDDLSLFVSWSPHDQVRFFAELEMETLLSSRGIAHFSESFSLERLYVDFLLSDSFSLRIGQFLTKVGRWNTTHAAPLVWTTTRPLVTESHFFPSRTNGLMLNQHWNLDNHGLDVSFYLDDSDDLDPRQISRHQSFYSEVAFRQATGISVQYEISDELQLGASYLFFKKNTAAAEQDGVNHLVGLDLLWQKDGYELQMEWAYRHARDRQGEEVGGYVQGIVPLAYKVFAVGRYEFLSGQHHTLADSFKGVSHVFVPALAWRPFFPLVLKAEYRFGKNNQQLQPSGFFASVSVLF